MGQVETADLDIAKAKVLIAQCDFDAAEKIVTSIPHTPESLDLTARLCVQKGDWLSARKAWELSLLMAPDNPDARDALRRLSSSWLFKALAARVVRLTALAALLAFSTAGILYLFNVLPEHAPSPPPMHAVSPRPSPMPELPTPGASLPPVARLEVTEPPEALVPATIPLPHLSIVGTTISTKDGHVSIVFNEGLFRYRDERSHSTERLLQSVISALSECPQVSEFIIIGHTDDEPMPTGALFESNYALGIARAASVASWFRNNSSIPQEAVVITSRGADDPPFSNADYESRLRNRTVVLRLQFQQPSIGEQP